jgi:signal transduction histidine kinase
MADNYTLDGDNYTEQEVLEAAEAKGLTIEDYISKYYPNDSNVIKSGSEDGSLEQPKAEKIEDVAKSAYMDAFYKSALPSSVKKGMTIVNVLKALPQIATDAEERKQLGQLMKNRIDNVPEALQSAILSSQAVAKDLFTADLDNLGYNEKQKEIREKAENTIIEKFNKIEELEFKDTGKGIVASAKEGDAAGLIASGFNFWCVTTNSSRCSNVY